MQQFIPFDDDWDALANLRPEDLVPYRVGMLKDHRASALVNVSAFREMSACERVTTESLSENG